MRFTGIAFRFWAGMACCLAAAAGSAQVLTAAAAAEVPPEQMNAALGMPLWADDNLWAQPVADVAARLNARVESDTGAESSYRVPAEEVFGVPPENMKIMGKNGTMDAVLVMFANKGDTLGMAPDQQQADNPRAYRKALIEFREREQQLAKTIRRQSDQLEQTLTAILGPYRKQRFGEGVKTSELVKIWQWGNHVFLLSEQKDASLSLRILATAMAESRGKAERIADGDLKDELQTRILRRDNGDVVITGIPMIDQGDKGYCVPTTWARYLRYMGIPADEYVLANAARTKKGGGTSTAGMQAAVSQLVKQNRRSIKTLTGRITLDHLAKYIDKGLPLMWRMYSVGPFEGVGQPADRMGSETPEAWSQSLEDARKAARKLKIDPDHHHVCMIIGYNPVTGEIATSDSWGLRHAEKWYAIEEAQAVSQNELYVISW